MRRKMSSGDWPFSKTRHTVMEDRSSPQSFSNLQNIHHCPAFPLTVHRCPSSDGGYPSSQSAQDSLEQYGSKRDEPTASLLTSNSSSRPRKGSSGSDRVFLTTSASGLDGDASLGGHFGGDSRLDSDLDELWYSRIGTWDEKESGECTVDDFHGKGICYGNTNDDFCTMSCATVKGDRWRIRSNCNSYVSCEAKSDYNKEANVSHFAKHSRGRAGSFDDRADFKASNHYLGAEEDYGSSCGSGEDQLQPADTEGSWLSISPTGEVEVRGQVGGRWKGTANPHGMSSGCGLQRSPVGINSRTYTQKLDSFSDAFFSQRKTRFQTSPCENSSTQIWENGVERGESAGLIKSRQSCAFDPDSYLPASSSSSPACSSLPPFPSPPTSSHLMSSVLSPPPTPLPPPSHSPSKTDSPSSQGGTGHSVPQGGDSLGGIQFFPSRIHSLPSTPSSGMVWKFPLLSHCFPQLSVDLNDTERNVRSSHSDDSGGVTAHPNVFPSPESSSFTSSSLHSGSPSLHAPFHLPFRSSHFFGKHHDAAGKTNPHKVAQKVKNDAVDLNQTHLQKQQSTPLYIGKPFPSILHSKAAHIRGRYTPRPLLNPVRSGTGLYSSLLSLHDEEDEQRAVLPCVNLGPDFQAELPPCVAEDEWSNAWSPEEESPREELLWKPWDELQQSTHIQDKVEKLLSVCSSSCLPGGGSNTELALHCLHHCQGNTMATLEMLLFSQPSPTGDYHYSGCDFWTDAEKSLFSAAFTKHGKDFSLAEKMVRTKTVSQCVEFYYLSKKLLDKQKKQKEDERRDAEELQKCMAPFSRPLERTFAPEKVGPVPSMASFFPCKLCGKMFYKIKSRNAHMKIHRQPQEDWTDRRLQHQLLAQRLALGRHSNLIPSPGSSPLPPQASALTFPSCGLASSSNSSVHNSVTNSIASHNVDILDASTAVAYSNITPQNSHLITFSDGGDRKDPSSVPFHQPWGSFGPPSDLSSFYCHPEGKEAAGAEAVEGKETIIWQ